MPSETSALWMRRLQYIVPIGIVLLLVALILPAIEQARESARRTHSKMNLIGIGLALQNYHDSHQTFPSGGTFDSNGVAYHGWTTSLLLLMSQRAYYDVPDSNYPWDDPVNVHRFLKEFGPMWQNASVSEARSPDDFPLVHFTANQKLFYRNSETSLNDIPERRATVLVGDANGKYPPLGYPYNWRDLSLGLGKSPDGFGCPVRPITMMLMADGSIRALTSQTDSQVALAMAGPSELKPTPEQIAKPEEPYRLKVREYWRYLNIVRAHKGLMTFQLSPNQKMLFVDFRGYDDAKEAVAEVWGGYFKEFLKDAPVEHVELEGHLRANELVPFLDIPTLKKLTLINAKISDDRNAVLTTARKEIVIELESPKQSED